MDPSPIVNEILKAFGSVLPIIIVIGLFKTPWAKGFFGELLVKFIAWLRLDKHTYRRVHDLTLPTPDGSTQIDHVFVSRFGIFVLETKNMRGWIFGGAEQAQWTQTLYRRTFRFQNPLRQNFKHVKALEAALRVPPETLHSVVTFVGGSNFKTTMPANVTQGAGFVAYIKSFRQPVFTAGEVEELLRRMASARLEPGFATHREHVQNLGSRADPNAERRCPRCGSPMVLRTVKAGARAGERFWGCSTFPKCRAIQNLA